MVLRTRNLGEIQVNEDAIICVPDGILGFEDLKHYIFVEVEEFYPFMWLLSVEDPEIGFAVSDPHYFFGAPYEVMLSDVDRSVLDLRTGDDISVFVIVSIADGARRITANLKGPIVLNTRNRLAKQVVVYSPSYSVRQSPLTLLPEHLPAAAMIEGSRAAARG